MTAAALPRPREGALGWSAAAMLVPKTRLGLATRNLAARVWPFGL